MAGVVVRKHRSEQEWRGLVQEQVGSGLSVRAWCDRHVVAESAFYRWRARCARPKARRGKTTFVPVRVRPDEPANHPGHIEIVLAGGRQIRLSGPVDRRVLAEVVGVLEGPAC